MASTTTSADLCPATTKQEVAARVLRERIATGAYPPGSRLPPWVDLAAEFEVSAITIERTMARLAREGFSEGRGRHGTFVTDHPPHLSQFALLFPSHPGPHNVQPWSHFYTALSMAATQRERLTPDCRIPLHYDVFPNAPTAD